MANPLSIFPDTLAAMKVYLDAQLALRAEPYTDDVLVTWDMPATRPDRVVLLRTDGGLTRGVTHASERMGLQIWAESNEIANDLGNMIHAMLRACVNDGPFRGPNYLSRVQQVTDPAGSKSHVLRYIATEMIVVSNSGA